VPGVTVRFRLALTVLLTGLATAIGVIVTVAIAFDRVGHQNTWQQANAFLGRVVSMNVDLLDQQERDPEGFAFFLRNLLLYQPDSQLYLLGPDGRVLASTGRARLAAGLRVTLGPVRQAAAAAEHGDPRQAAYVMGDDPEYMDAGAVIAARALARSVIRPSRAVAGYLYLVSRPPGLPSSRLELLSATLLSPALAPILAVCLLGTLLAAWIIAAVTRPLRVLSNEVAQAALAGFSGAAALSPAPGAPATSSHGDEFARLRGGFHALLATLRAQWDELRRLDHFRRESVSNLSHDLRSPLTATVACLETLEQRWRDQPGRADDRRLIEVALRNTRNAAGLVRALGDLALLDEPEFKLKLLRLDLAEVLDDIALRFAERAARLGVGLRFEQRGSTPPVAVVDIELFERALANLLDNALKFTQAGAAIVIAAECAPLPLPPKVRVSVEDQGRGIPAADLPHLFDRHYQSRSSVAPATSDEGKGLGLAIVKRIAELHQGRVAVSSQVGHGTVVTIELPAG
jgi:signal transduction histidine kinase